MMKTFEGRKKFRRGWVCVVLFGAAIAAFRQNLDVNDKLGDIENRELLLGKQIAGKEAASSTKRSVAHKKPKRRNIPIARDTPVSRGRPLLRSVLDFQSRKIIGDPQFLLDFAIIGFPKTGTTSMLHWLGRHEEIAMLPGENFALFDKLPGRLVHSLYTTLPSNQSIKRGYKNPLDIRAGHTLQSLRKYFPKTTLIVGIRHPVRWLESHYNFKVQNLPTSVHPSAWGNPNKLIGKCWTWDDINCVGTGKGLFHIYLASLGKVAMPSRWLKDYPHIFAHLEWNTTNIKSIRNPVFLYESSQLSANYTSTESIQFRQDVKKLLNLSKDLPPIPREKPDFDHFSPKVQRKKDKHKIDICLPRYRPIRAELMKIGREASVWIRQSFLSSPEVYVSSREKFVKILEGWMVDPCDAKTKSVRKSKA